MKATVNAILVVAILAMPALGGTISGKADCGGDCENFLVYIEGGPTQNGQGTSVDFDQRDKVFIPHVLPVLQGATVNIKNGDPFLHNVHVYQGKDTVLNIALPFQGQVIEHSFSEPGVYDVSCDAHPEMSAYIVVLESPHFTTPNEDGTYEITDVPTGTYSLAVSNLKKDEIIRSSVQVE